MRGGNIPAREEVDEVPPYRHARPEELPRDGHERQQRGPQHRQRLQQRRGGRQREREQQDRRQCDVLQIEDRPFPRPESADALGGAEGGLQAREVVGAREARA